ncbi:uncharacterized protein LOC106662452 [Cimex lectularius]|uniref:Allatostatin CC n=1 Tax=Cimex lectularius TaxID=79782 RepID=A0A8I6RBD4_CIMLE|nr:uncharacterized protein LOC106662452 [Cimex lectularius]
MCSHMKLAEKDRQPSAMCHRNQISCLICWWLVMVLTVLVPASASPAPKYTDYQQMGVSYDEYPVVVPKRAAVLLDRLMVALQKAVDSDHLEDSVNRIPLSDKMDLQRRGQQKGGRTYWRCYFNAVSCF